MYLPHRGAIVFLRVAKGVQFSIVPISVHHNKIALNEAVVVHLGAIACLNIDINNVLYDS